MSESDISKPVVKPQKTKWDIYDDIKQKLHKNKDLFPKEKMFFMTPLHLDHPAPNQYPLSGIYANVSPLRSLGFAKSKRFTENSNSSLTRVSTLEDTSSKYTQIGLENSINTSHLDTQRTSEIIESQSKRSSVYFP